MASTKMSGPDCKGILEFRKSIADMPSHYKAPFEAITNDTLEAVTDTGALTVWETDADVDGLLQLTEVYLKVRAANTTKTWNSSSKKAMGMIIISQEKEGRDAYQRIVDLLCHLTDTRGDKHLNGKVYAFGSVVVVKGIDYSKSRSRDEDKEVIRCVNTAIDRVLKMTRQSGNKPKIVWNHGPALHLLLKWINHTKDELRSALKAITITAAVSFASGIKPTDHGKGNKPDDLKTLEKYASRLNIPVLFLDPVTQLIYNEYASHYIYYFGYYITMFLPPTVTRPHYYKALDSLTTFAFQLWGATKNKYGEEVVKQVKQHLNGERARHWARNCIDPASYTKPACLSAGEEIALQHAGSLADSPWAMYTTLPETPLPAFTRIPICPGASSSSIYHAAPVTFNVSRGTYKVSNPSPFRILVPKEDIDIDKMTQRIQGTMSAVLTRVIELKDGKKPAIGDMEAQLWEDMIGAVTWALGECTSGLPEAIKGKVDIVGRMLVLNGCWPNSVKGRGKEGEGKEKGKGKEKVVTGWGTG
jgi:hypothetical protein